MKIGASPFVVWIAILALWTGLNGAAAELPVTRWQGRTMGSPYKVQIAGTNLPSAALDVIKAEVEERLKEINRQMSHYQPDSELSQFNRAPAKTPFKVSPEFARVIRFSLELAHRSDGAFDPTLGPVVNLWGFGEKTEQRAVPAEADLKAALALTGYRHLAITAGDELIKDIPGLTLNLSGVAKGFGVDEMVRVIRQHGHTNVYVSIAGEVMVLGHNPRGTPWQVGISEPLANWRENDPMALVAALSNRAISTSGDYQNFFVDARGRRLSHIFDPRTGWPVQHQVGGVSVVAPDSMTADALATTLFVLGEEPGLRFIEAWPDAAAVFIVRESEGTFRQVRSRGFDRLAGIQR
jgi:thiamine biosynthesis lipoprotein